MRKGSEVFLLLSWKSAFGVLDAALVQQVEAALKRWLALSYD